MQITIAITNKAYNRPLANFTFDTDVVTVERAKMLIVDAINTEKDLEGIELRLRADDIISVDRNPLVLEVGDGNSLKFF